MYAAPRNAAAVAAAPTVAPATIAPPQAQVQYAPMQPPLQPATVRRQQSVEAPKTPAAAAAAAPAIVTAPELICTLCTRLFAVSRTASLSPLVDGWLLASAGRGG